MGNPKRRKGNNQAKPSQEKKPRKEEAKKKKIMVSTTSFENEMRALEATIAEKMYERGHARANFLRYDEERKGKLSREDFAHAVKDVSGICLDTRALTYFVERYDMDHDGKINYEEFRNMSSLALEKPRTENQTAYAQAVLENPCEEE